MGIINAIILMLLTVFLVQMNGETVEETLAEPEDGVLDNTLLPEPRADSLRAVSNGTSGSGSCACGQRKTVKRRTISEENDLDLNRIVGGTEAGLNEFPWRCALFYEDRNKNVRFYCGCSLIGQQWVMTAAHCTDPLKRAKLLVNLGDHDLSTLNETQNQVIPVEKLIQHQKYNKRTMDNDISLLKLKTAAKMADNVSPVCLPFGLEDNVPPRATVTASGWGVTREGSRTRPSTLRKVDLEVIPPDTCRRFFGRGQITNNMMCTLSIGKDACQGDSGSSIDYLNAETERTYALGIVSFGRGCGRRNGPGVYTAVTKFIPWIKANAGNEFCEP